MDAAEIIKQNKAEIIEKWLQLVNRYIPESKIYSKPALSNDIPEFLDKLVISIRKKTGWEKEKPGVEHGRLRAMFHSYSLLHVVCEFRLLKIVLLNKLDEFGQIDRDDRNQILTFVDIAVEEASEAFFQQRFQREAKARGEAEEKVSDLESLHDERDHFVASVSHDLRNPISNIMQCVTLIRRGLPREYVDNELLDIIAQSAERADQLIRNLLDVNLIRSGRKLPVHPGRCDLLKEAKDCLDSFALTFSNRFSIEAHEKEVVGVWDCLALRRALDNLVQNAVKYGKMGGPVTISCRQTFDSTMLSVHNEGQPIPLNRQADIFTYHVQKGEVRGSWGLGLPLVKGVAEAHGGKVDLESSPEKGTTFTLTLPNDSSSLPD